MASIKLGSKHQIRCQTDPAFMSTVVTGEENLISGFSLETKLCTSQWKSLQSEREGGNSAQELYQE